MTPDQFKARLKALGLTYDQAAMRLCIHPRTIRKYAAGDLSITRVLSLALQALKENHKQTKARGRQ